MYPLRQHARSASVGFNPDYCAPDRGAAFLGKAAKRLVCDCIAFISMCCVARLVSRLVAPSGRIRAACMRHRLFLPSRIYTRDFVHTKRSLGIRGVSMAMIPEIRSPVAERRRSKRIAKRVACRRRWICYRLLKRRVINIYILITIIHIVFYR